ncbi:MAG: hypothetical protein AB7M05_13620 [Alphaproteobacteria bacterium]
MPASAAFFDETARYRALSAEEGFDREAIEAAFLPLRARVQGMHVVVAPSYLAGFAMPARNFGLYDFFLSEERWLLSEGALVTIAPLNPAGTVEENAAILAAIVRASERPVCLVSHSKGGLDTLEMLLRADPETRGKIACWIAQQAPFHGSPVADRMTRLPGQRLAVVPLFALIGGSRRSLEDLTTAERQHYLAEHAGAIESLSAELPILSVATYLSDGDPMAGPSVATILRRAVDWRGEPNDGLVPLASQMLPYARYIVLPGLDHARTITSRAFGPRMDRASFIKLLLVLVLTREGESQP